MVGHRSRIGDWEGDTLIGRHRRGVLVSLVERKGGYTVLAESLHLISCTIQKYSCAAGENAGISN